MSTWTKIRRFSSQEQSGSAEEWVEQMNDHYFQTGTVRAQDAARVLGRQISGVDLCDPESSLRRYVLETPNDQTRR